jgi:hypothetical protein
MTQQFDDFSKSLAQPIPRRESLRRLGAVLAGAVLSPLGFEAASAAGPDPCKAFCKCRNKTQQSQCLAACKACNGDTLRLCGSCGGYACTDLANDVANCGSCGNNCWYEAGANEEAACFDGECFYPCAEGAAECNGACTYLDWDQTNCGACGNACDEFTPFCNGGVCEKCPPGRTECGEFCHDLAFDNYHCGACDNACGGSTPRCYLGVCTECTSGDTNCDGQCVNLTSNSANCGACGNVCGGATPYCSSGICTTCEGAGGALCGGVCTDILFDGGNCGACGYACQPLEFCSWGMCEGYYYGDY